MKRSVKYLCALLALALCLAGCGQGTVPASSLAAAPSEAPESPAAPAGDWESVHGVFSRDDSTQYNDGLLGMMHLSDGIVLVEFDLTQGSEAEDTVDDYGVAFTMLVDESGIGRYEAPPDAASPFTVDIALSDGGQKATVTQTGDLPISCAGSYTFVESNLEVSEYSALALLEHLPTATTSLNSNNGAYTLQLPDSLVADWFYPVEATFDDTGAVLARFIVANDLSAVYRVDDGIEPTLIYGSAQPMMEAQVYPLSLFEEAEAEEEPDTTLAEPMELELTPVVSVGMADGAFLPMGGSGRLEARLPWELTYALSGLSSSEPAVAIVDDQGVVTAVDLGETVISGTLSIDDGQRPFEVAVTVDEVQILEEIDLSEVAEEPSDASDDEPKG